MFFHDYFSVKFLRFDRRFPTRLKILCVFLSFAIGCASTGGVIEFNKLTSTNDLPNQDKKLWNMSQYEEEYLQKSGLIYADSVLGDYLQQVGQRVLPKEFKSSIIPFRFRAITDPELNAFALPNGNIFVHVGLLARMDNESQLAQVLGHEVTHVTRRHAVHRYAHVKNVAGFTQILSMATAIGFAQMQSGWAGFWNDLAQSALYLTAIASISGYGRAEEKEADLKSLDYMIAANYDVQEAPKVFEHLLAEYKDPSATAAFFYADHPRLKGRIAYVKAAVESLSVQSAMGGITLARGNEEYRRRTDLLRRKQVALWIRSGKPRNALKDAERVIAEHPDDPRVRFWGGEALRLIAKHPDTLALAKTEFLTALQMDSTFAEPHRGLGALAEAQFDSATALQEYQIYLALSPKAKDRRYVNSRIEALSSKAKREDD